MLRREKVRLGVLIAEIGVRERSLALSQTGVGSWAPLAALVALDEALVHHLGEDALGLVVLLLLGLHIGELILEAVDGLELVLDSLSLRQGL